MPDERGGHHNLPEKPYGPMTAENPFFAPKLKPTWARLTRLGGDRVSILLDDFRKRISIIEGLTEELLWDGADKGWAATYSVGGKQLLEAHVLAGSLEVVLRLSTAERDRLLAATRLAAPWKRALAGARDQVSEFVFRISVKSPAQVRSLARLAALINRLNKG